MISLILLAGMDELEVEKIVDGVSSTQSKIVRLSAMEAAGSQIDRLKPRLVLLGTRGADIDEGLALVRAIKSSHPNLPVVLISRTSCEARAVAAFRAGVDDYFTPSLPADGLSRFLNPVPSKAASARAMPRPAGSGRGRDMIGESRPMASIKAHLARIAATTSTVLLTGETGTGKDLAAEIIHWRSRRCGQPFVRVNCAALPENLLESELFGHKKGAFTGAVADRKGTFEIASGGTLFLDEIGDMSPSCQAKMLLSIEHKWVYPLGARAAVPADVRIVAATNQELETLVDEGRFRPDLYYRLNVARVHLPPLRERKEDIPQLIAHMIDRLNRQFDGHIEGVAPEAMTALLGHRWPGNVRELHNTLESAFINCSSRKIQFGDLPPAMAKKLDFVDDPQLNERDKLLTVLTAAQGNKSMAAKQLKWSRMRVYRVLKRYSLEDNL